MRLVIVRSAANVPSFGPITGPFFRTCTWSVTSCAGNTFREPDPSPGKAPASPAKCTVTAPGKYPGRTPATLTLGSVATPLASVTAVPTKLPLIENSNVRPASGPETSAFDRVAVSVVVPPAVAVAASTATATCASATWKLRMSRTGLLVPGCGKVLVAYELIPFTPIDSVEPSAEMFRVA